MVCDTPASNDAFTHQIWNSYLKEYKRYVPHTIIFKSRSGQGEGHSDPKMIYDTLSSQYAFTHQIWNSYLKEYMNMHQNQCSF